MALPQIQYPYIPEAERVLRNADYQLENERYVSLSKYTFYSHTGIGSYGILPTEYAYWINENGQLTIYDIKSGKIIRNIPDVHTKVKSSSFSPDGQNIVYLNSRKNEYDDVNHYIVQYNIKTGKHKEIMLFDEKYSLDKLYIVGGVIVKSDVKYCY